MNALTHRRPTMPALVLLVLGLLPAGQSWLHLVALPAITFETSLALRLSMSDDRREILEKQRSIAKNGTPFEKATLALLVILGSRR